MQLPWQDPLGDFIDQKLAEQRARDLGHALGDSIASGMQTRQGVGPWSAGDYRNGSDVQSDCMAGTGVAGLRIAQDMAAAGRLRYGFDELMQPADYSLTGGKPGRLPNADYAIKCCTPG